jgi:hypothetical protein
VKLCEEVFDREGTTIKEIPVLQIVVFSAIIAYNYFFLKGIVIFQYEDDSVSEMYWLRLLKIRSSIFT